MKKSSQSQIDENWWIDYVEGDVSPEQKQDMEMLLQYSLTDRLILENICAVRSAVEKVGKELEPPTEESYYQDLRGRIMEQVGGQWSELAAQPKEAWWANKVRKWSRA